MNDSQITDAMGVDGGGTGCRIGLIRHGKRHELKVGPANVTSDFDTALSTIRDGLAAIAQQAGTDLAALQGIPAHIGLAGVTDTASATRVADALPLQHTTVTDDVPPTVVGAFGDGNGAVAGIGTGSFIARQHDQQIDTIGGHGFVLGDEASGAWLGRTLLSRVLHVLDGMHPPSPLTDSVAADFNHNTSEIVAFAANATPHNFGTFAPRVVDAADTGDTTGRAILQTGTAYVLSALTTLGWTTAEPLCLTGGVGPRYAAFLPPDVAAAIQSPKGPALDGALQLARRSARALQ